MERKGLLTRIRKLSPGPNWEWRCDCGKISIRTLADIRRTINPKCGYYCVKRPMRIILPVGKGKGGLRNSTRPGYVCIDVKKLTAYREANGYTRGKVCYFLNIYYTQYTRIESGKSPWVHPDLAKRLASVLHTDLTNLLNGDSNA